MQRELFAVAALRTMTATETAPSSATPTTRRKRKRRRKSSPVERWDLYGIVVCAAGAGLLATDASATRFRAFDAVLVGAFAALVTLAGSRARRWSVIWLAGIAAAGAIGSIWAAPAAVALALGAVAAVSRKRSRILDAAIAGLAVQSVLHYPNFGPHGLPTVVALVATVPVLASGYRSSSSKVRRVARLSAFGVAGYVVVATLFAAFAGLAAKGSLDRAVAAGDDGLALMKQGKQAEATARFDEAASSFDTATGLVSGPWNWPSALVPGVARQPIALTGLASGGASVAHSVSDTARVAPYTDVQLSGGAVDVTRLAAMEAPVRRQADALRNAGRALHSAESSWLVPQVHTPLTRFAAAVDEAMPSADLAANLTRVTPRVLGGSGAQRYLVLVSDSSEARFSGGSLTAYGEVTANDGRLSLVRWGPISDLAADPSSTAADAQGDRTYADRYGRYLPQQNPTNLAASPDFPTDVRVITDRYSRAGGVALDGVFLVDPIGLAALLALTGPIDVVGAPAPLTAENAASFLLTDQYVGGRTASDSLLGAAGESATRALLRRDIPGAATVGDELAAASRAGHLQLGFVDGDTQKVFDGMGVSGTFPVGDHADFFSVRTASEGDTRLNQHVTRKVRYDAAFNPTTGAVDATATVALTNAPPTALLASPVARSGAATAPGTVAMYVSFYSPLGLRSLDVNGGAVPIEPQREFAGNVYSVRITIAPGATASVRLKLGGTIKADATYHLVLSGQPSPVPDQATVFVTGTGGWTVERGDAGEHRVDIVGATEISVGMKRG